MNNNRVAVSFEEAQKIILNSVNPLGSEIIPIQEAAGRILFEDIVSDIMIPGVDDSAMDGYAIIAEDAHGASNSNPVKLKISGEIQAGGSAAGKQVLTGTAIRIMTGAPIPAGADSVIQFEDTEEESGHVRIFREINKYSNYRFAGENIKKGDRVLDKGDRMNSADAGILSSLNYKEVKVFRKPSVSIISTGNELADSCEEIRAGRIRNINMYTLYSEVKKHGAIPVCLGTAKDTLKDTREIFLKALESDVVISTGGISRGKYDFVKEVYSDLNIEIMFEGVRIKPGSPFTFGKKNEKLIFGLPGNPVPTLTSFIQFVRPALLRLMGAKKFTKPVVNAMLEEDINSGKVHHLVRGYFTIKGNELFVSTTGNQKPSVLRSMSEANCLIVIPEHITKVKAGEKVMIQLIDHDEI